MLDRGAPVTSPPSTAIPGSWNHVATTQFAGSSGHTGQTCAIRTDQTLWCRGTGATSTPQILAAPTAVD